MSNVIKLQRKPRPLRATYQPSAPYTVERMDHESGSILYEVVDMRPESYRTVCFTDDDCGRNGYAKYDAEQIARGLNFLLQCGKENLPNVREHDDFEMENDDD